MNSIIGRIKRWLGYSNKQGFMAVKEGDIVFCSRCARECVCGGECPYCGFPAPGPSHEITKI